jgi:hypothetical protein
VTESDKLSRAAVLYFGLGEEKSPRFVFSRLSSQFGVEEAEALVEAVRELIAEASEIPVPEDFALMDEVSVVEREMERRHPDLSADAIKSLMWNYGYVRWHG